MRYADDDVEEELLAAEVEALLRRRDREVEALSNRRTRRHCDWDCPGCNDRQLARHPAWCRMCGTPRPWDEFGCPEPWDHELYDELDAAYYDDLELYLAGLSGEIAESERARLLPDY